MVECLTKFNIITLQSCKIKPQTKSLKIFNFILFFVLRIKFVTSQIYVIVNGKIFRLLAFNSLVETPPFADPVPPFPVGGAGAKKIQMNFPSSWLDFYSCFSFWPSL